MRFRFKGRIPAFLFFAFWLVYFPVFWSRAVFIDPAGNIMAGHLNVWGDWTLHFLQGSAMAVRSLVLMENPLLVGAPFVYPFMNNFLSALLIRAGFPFLLSYTVPSCVESVALVVLLYFFYKTLLRSPGSALIASLLFMWNGGLGVFISPPSLGWPLRKYAVMDDAQIFIGNVVDSMIVPQRAFTLGFPVALLILLLVYGSFPAAETEAMARQRYRKAVAAGVLFGLLPLIHTHSFVCMGGILVFVTFGQWIKSGKFLSAWFLKPAAVFWTAAGVIGVPALTWLLNSGGPTHRPFWRPGWYAGELGINWGEFWLKNWGFVPVLAVFGLWALWRHSINRAARWGHVTTFFPFFLLFAAVNLYQFHAWIWDNTKYLVWVSLGFSGLAGTALTRLSQSGITGRWAARLLLLVSISSGFLDTIYIQRATREPYLMYAKEDVELASWVRENTPSSSVWLAADHHHNWLPDLAGRKVMLTNTSILFHHGYDYSQVQADTWDMLKAPDQHQPLFEKYRIQFIDFPKNFIESMNLKRERFDSLFTFLHETEHHVLYARKI